MGTSGAVGGAASRIHETNRLLVCSHERLDLLAQHRVAGTGAVEIGAPRRGPIDFQYGGEDDFR